MRKQYQKEYSMGNWGQETDWQTKERRWEDAVKEDNRKILKLAGWRRLASDEQRWRGKLQEYLN